MDAVEWRRRNGEQNFKISTHHSLDTRKRIEFRTATLFPFDNRKWAVGTLRLNCVSLKKSNNRRLFFSFLVSDKPEDEDTEVMKNLMDDIQSGFVQRRLPDGGFKVSTWPEKNKKRIHLELPRFNCASFFEGNGNGKKGSRIIFDWNVSRLWAAP